MNKAKNFTLLSLTVFMLMTLTLNSIQAQESTCSKKKVMKLDVDEDRPFMGVYLGKEEQKTIINNANGTVDEVIIVNTKASMEGAYINDVVPGGSAEAAGLQGGDVITMLNGNAVKSIEELSTQLKAFTIGQTINVVFIRNGENITQPLTLKKYDAAQIDEAKLAKYVEGVEKSISCSRPMSTCSKSASTCSKSASACSSKKVNANKVRLGVMLENSETVNGVYVAEVSKNGAAEKAGMMAGDIIVKMHKTTVNNYEELVAVLGNYVPGDKVKVQFLRDGKKQKTKATLKAAAKSCATKESCCPSAVQMACCPSKTLSAEFTVIITDMTKQEKKEIEDVIEQDNKAMKMTDMEALEVQDLQFFPNPNDGKFTLSFNSIKNEETLVRIVDVKGQEVYANKLNSGNGGFQQNIDISENAKGVYILQLIQGNKMLSKKISVQ